MKIKCGGLTFTSDFDSGNLAKVEFVSSLNKIHIGDSSNGSSSSSPPNLRAGDSPAKKVSQNNCNQAKEQKSSPRASKSGSFPVIKVNKSHKHAVPVSPARCQGDAMHVRKKVVVLEFKIWTKPDCAGTPFENSFRSWFHFGVEGGIPGTVIKIHVMNLNRQGKLFFYGMRPVFRVVPAKDSWKRIPGKVHYKSESDGNFVINFSHALPAQAGTIIYFAFTYPFPYTDCQKMLEDVEKDMGSSLYTSDSNLASSEDAIYYCRELLCYSLDGRRVDLLTVTSCRGVTTEREPRLPHLFPDHSKPRCHVFRGKKVIFLSSRVHPGETPSSFVFNGFLRHLLSPKDPKACQLRHLFIFKLIPMLNPDGVYRGHFRTDPRGINLNRMYLIASPELHPSVHAARSLLLHYHMFYSSSAPSSSSFENSKGVSKSNKTLNVLDSLSYESKASHNSRGHTLYSSKSDLMRIPSVRKLIAPAYSTSSLKHAIEITGDLATCGSMKCPESSVGMLHKGFSSSEICLPLPSESVLPAKTPLEFLLETLSGNLISKPSLDFSSKNLSGSLNSGSSNEYSKEAVSPSHDSQASLEMKDFRSCSDLEASDAEETSSSHEPEQNVSAPTAVPLTIISPEKSGVAYYFDLHGHACKRGCFIYGNFFPDIDRKVECMLLGKLMAINCPYFDFAACNFTAENMRSSSKKDGQSKEGSGRVALHTFTGIIHSYTLECNYNTVHSSAPLLQGEGASLQVPLEKSSAFFFTPEIFDQVGAALLESILDASGQNVQSLVAHSPFGSLHGVREWLQKYAVAVSKKNKNHYLKKNALSTPLIRKSPKDKAVDTPVSTVTAKKPSNREPQQFTQGVRTSRLAANTKRNVMNAPVSNEKFLADFGVKYKRQHVSESSPGPFSSPPSKCIDNLKKLLNTRNPSFSNPKAFSKTSSLRSAPRKAKGVGFKSEKAALKPVSRQPSVEMLSENHNTVKSDPLVTPRRCPGAALESSRGRNSSSLSALGLSKKGAKSKKNTLPSFQSSEHTASQGLLQSSGNLRAKKKNKSFSQS